jgi:hypothetical protein
MRLKAVPLNFWGKIQKTTPTCFYANILDLILGTLFLPKSMFFLNK